MKNTLYYGDNLDILKRYIKDESEQKGNGALKYVEKF